MTSEPTEVFAELLTPVGQELLAVAGRDDLPADPLAAATALRRATLGLLDERPDGDHPRLPGGATVGAAELAGAALTQARLRERAVAKFGAEARRMYFTPDGMEQATRGVVATYRAARFAAAVAALPDQRARRPVADLCCGVGADLLALARHGLGVVGVEADPLTAAVAAANVDALGLGDRASVRRGDAAAADTLADALPGGLAGAAAVFCDPARRGARGRVFDPDAYAPPWDVAVELARHAPAAGLKAAPGIPHDRVPADADPEWISAGGEVKEAALWFGALRGGGRRATLLPGGPPEPGGGAPRAATLVHDPGLGAPPVAPVGRYLYEPDGAVVRAGLVAEVAARVDGALLDPRIAYVTADRHVATPFCRAYAVTDVMPFSVKRLRSYLRRNRVGNVTIKKRGSAVDPTELHRALRASGPESAVVFLTRIGDKPVCVVGSDLPPAAAPRPAGVS